MTKKIENDLKIVKEKIIKKFKPERIILFGSYAWGGVTKNSDIDLFIVKDSKKSKRQRQIELRTILFGSNTPIDVLSYTSKEIDKRLELNDPFVKKIINTGKVLYEIKK